MRIVERIADLQLPRDRKIGFVPTMGAFHEGHLQLMRKAKETTDCVVVSLFVNPLQFGQGEDFERYPRNLEMDAEMARSVGVDVLFAPSTSEMYPQPTKTVVSVQEVSKRWEGEHRPGHFDGVATVVAKLFNIIRPDLAFFGRKDLQQCAVVKRMALDLNMGIEISVEPTVREPDGLAMSSRNRYLNQQQRTVVPRIFIALNECRDGILNGESVTDMLSRAKGFLEEVSFQIDYLAYVSEESFEPLDRLQEKSALICAAFMGSTRLIDNLQVA